MGNPRSKPSIFHGAVKFRPTVTDRIMEKEKRFNLQAPPVYDRKVTNLFFSIIIVSIISFFHNSVGDCMSIDSQFECILRGNIEL